MQAKQRAGGGSFVASIKSESFILRKRVREKLGDAKYKQHIVKKWTKIYFPYDEAKFLLGSLNASTFDPYFDGVIRVVINFIELTKETIRSDLMTTIESINVLNKEEVLDREFLKLHGKVLELKKFLDFNKFYILRFVQKYYRSILTDQNVLRSRANVDHVEHSEATKQLCEWSTMLSYHTFLDLCQMDQKLDELQSNLVENYVPMKKHFCGDMGAEDKLYASGELYFPQSRNEVKFLDLLSLKIGLKGGAVVGCSCILVAKKYFFGYDLSVDHPGINIFGAYAAYLLYRILWLLNVSIWDKTSVQYIHFFKFGIIRAQTFRILNEILSETILFLFCYVAYVESLSDDSSLSGVINPGYITLALLVAILRKLVYRIIFKFGKRGHDRGVFNLTIFWRCLVSPYYTATFRDKMAANILTSFSRPVSDFLRGTCWLVSGQVFNSDRYTTTEDVKFCNDSSFYVVIVSIQIFFSWIRMVQSLQGMKNANWKVYPHGLNASKYGLGILLKWYILVFPDQALSLVYIIMIVFNALLRWYWDVVMDWGLGVWSLNLDSSLQHINFSVPWGYPSDDDLGIRTKEIRSHFVESQRLGECEEQIERSSIALMSGDFRHADVSEDITHTPDVTTNTNTNTWKYFLLRPQLFLFDNQHWVYHVVIFLDLILRFFFVISFLPQKKLVEILGSDLPFYLGCFEILRRAMWMTFRLEWEHIKFVALCIERGKEQVLAKDEGVQNILQTQK